MLTDDGILPLPVVVLVDVDGVIVTEHRFPAFLRDELGVSPELSRDFFGHWLREAQCGRCDLYDILRPHLARWSVDLTPEEFTRQWFMLDSRLDPGLLEAIAELRRAGVQCHLATMQEPRRMQSLWGEARLAEHFDGYFASCDLGHGKDEVAYFRIITKRLAVPRPKVLMVDDVAANVQAARRSGLEGYLYTTDVAFRRYLADRYAFPARARG